MGNITVKYMQDIYIDNLFSVDVFLIKVENKFNNTLAPIINSYWEFLLKNSLEDLIPENNFYPKIIYIYFWLLLN